MKEPITKYGHIPKHLGLGLQHISLGETKKNQAITIIFGEHFGLSRFTFLLSYELSSESLHGLTSLTALAMIVSARYPSTWQKG